MLRIGELAELVGVTTRTIRHYHRIGLLPEAERSENGYRCYGLDDAVRLLRIRRMTELGLSLDEAADVLADDEGRDLRDMLSELDVDLATQEARLRARRDAVAVLLGREGDLRVPAELAGLSAQMATVFGPDHPAVERERLVLELLGPATGGHDEASSDLYRQVLADRELATLLAELSRRFEALDGLGADDPAVDALVTDAAGAGDAVLALLPDEPRGSPGDPRAAGLLLGAVSAGMGPAQARCLALLFDAWWEASS